MERENPRKRHKISPRTAMLSRKPKKVNVEALPTRRQRPRAVNAKLTSTLTQATISKGQAYIKPDANSSKINEDGGPHFTLFNKFPVEIQVKIFGYAAPHSSCLIKSSMAFPSYLRGDAIKDWAAYYRSDQRVPSVLQVCRWLRAEFLYHDGLTKDHIIFRLYREMSTLPWTTSAYVADGDVVYIQHESMYCHKHFVFLKEILSLSSRTP